LAADLNPVVKFFDPLGLSEAKFWRFTNEETIGWLRHSEIKHGRVAMAAFVGYCVQSNFVLPYPLTLNGDPHPSVDLFPPEQWDALPYAAKIQIILFIGFLEAYSESSGTMGLFPHYTKGGQPGKFPTFAGKIPHFAPDLYDPLGRAENMSDEAKTKGLKAELNNGRLAMIGIFGFLCEQTIPGSVPLLTGIVKPYSGDMIGSLDFTL